jgi:hypothetical protein
MIQFEYENIDIKKRMFTGSCLTSKLYNKIIKMPSKSHETIPLIMEAEDHDQTLFSLPTV